MAPRIQATPQRVRVALVLSGWFALAATLLPAGGPLRWVPVLLFTLIGPGLALLLPMPDGLRPGSRLEVVAMAAPLSLSLGVLTATALFLVERFSGAAFLVVLALFTTAAAFFPGLPLPAATRGAAERPRRGPAPR
ncbi:hypothetical protein [Streptomyces sp. NPDC060194]|uniref:hypothetical protein n=1 Tax=Streptomyces sp. NPDC060194 TaxID=3347069 RepID=UPI003664033B